MKKTVEEIISIYEKAGKIMKESILSGEYKRHNKENAKLIKFFKEFEKNQSLGYECIDRLLESSNVVIQTKAAAYCLALNYRVKYAEKKLQKISANSENGIFGFNAEMTLKEWNKKGYLKIYR